MKAPEEACDGIDEETRASGRDEMRDASDGVVVRRSLADRSFSRRCYGDCRGAPGEVSRVEIVSRSEERSVIATEEEWTRGRCNLERSSTWLDRSTRAALIELSLRGTGSYRRIVSTSL